MAVPRPRDPRSHRGALYAHRPDTDPGIRSTRRRPLTTPGHSAQRGALGARGRRRYRHQGRQADGRIVQGQGAQGREPRPVAGTGGAPPDGAPDGGAAGPGSRADPARGLGQEPGRVGRVAGQDDGRPHERQRHELGRVSRGGRMVGHETKAMTAARVTDPFLSIDGNEMNA